MSAPQVGQPVQFCKTGFDHVAAVVVRVDSAAQVDVALVPGTTTKNDKEYVEVGGTPSGSEWVQEIALA